MSTNPWVNIAPDHVRVVFPSRMREVGVVAGLTVFGLGVVPALMTFAIGPVFAFAWCVVAAVVLEPLVSSIHRLLRPRVDVTIGLHALAVERGAWIGAPERRRWAWEQLANVELCHVDERDLLGIALLDTDGWPIRTAIRGRHQELAPLAAYIRERIAASHRPPDPGQDAAREALDQLRRGVRPL